MARPLRPGWRAFNDLATNETLLGLDLEYFRAWFQVMCAAQPHDGVLPMGIAKLFNWSTAKGIRYLTHLERAGLIEKHKQTFRVVHWASAGKPPEPIKERVKRFRERKKAGVTLPQQIIDAQETLREPQVTLHDPTVTLHPTEEEKTQQNQLLTSSDSPSSTKKTPSPSAPPSPQPPTEVIETPKEKKEETIEVGEGRAQARVTLHAPTKAATETLRKPKKGEPEGFAEAWAAYPGRGQARNPRKTAVAAYAKALTVKGATADLILYGIKAYAEALRKTGKLNTEFVAMMATWLNQQSWQQYAPVISSTASERLRAGATAPIQKVFVDEGTEAWDAWQAYLRAHGKPGSAKTAVMDEKTHLRREGWWFVSAYPPGHQNGNATEVEQGRAAAEVQGERPWPDDEQIRSADGAARPTGEDGSSDDFGTTPSDEGFGG